jgi:hypothetical protein
MKNQISYQIRWDLLDDDEIDFLDRIGTKRLPSSIEFSKIPNWEDYCLAFAYLIGLETRTHEEGNHIKFAISDCANFGDKIFGQEKVEKWYEDYFKLRNIRDFTLNRAGGVLIYLQLVENEVKLTCSILKLKHLNLTIKDFFTDDPNWRKVTLGQLALAIKKNQIFNEEFEIRLGRFVDLRNDFIHNLWVSKKYKEETKSGLPSEKEFLRINNFISSMIKEATYVRNVFRGLQYQMMPSKLKADSNESMTFSSWAKYIPYFQGVIRDTEIYDQNVDNTDKNE